jgi:hypothetical protein
MVSGQRLASSTVLTLPQAISMGLRSWAVGVHLIPQLAGPAFK